MTQPRPLRILINAQLTPQSGVGGVESVLVGLVRALGGLIDGDEEYVVVGARGCDDWWQPHLGPNARVVPGPASSPKPWPARAAARLLRGLGAAPPGKTRVPVSDGFFEGLDCDVIHFPYQHFVRCALPSVFNPHDLQHLHYPEFFSVAEVESREAMYRAGCSLATCIVTASRWVKDDLVRQYQVPQNRIQIVPWASPMATEMSRTAPVSRPTFLPVEPYAFYPSMTWPHKNHIRLLEALALLRDREGLRVPLVCTGYQNEFWPNIRDAIVRLALADQVTFAGLVSRDELSAVYAHAQFVIVPTLFEAASAPLFEAWQHDVPVTCSSVTSLPEQAGEAALLFDPFSVEAIADALRALATDTGLQNLLRLAGRQRREDFSWERTARAYRAVYRKAAGRRLSEEDLTLLDWDWMRNPAAPAGAA